VKFSLAKGCTRGGAVLTVTIEERGSIIINALHFGTSEATTYGAVSTSPRRTSSAAGGVGGGFVASTRPHVDGAEPARAFSLRAAGPVWSEGTLGPYGSFLYSNGSEFYRASGGDDDSNPRDFVAANTRRVGGTLGVGPICRRAIRVTAEAATQASMPGCPSAAPVRTRASRVVAHPLRSASGTEPARLYRRQCRCRHPLRPVLPSHGTRTSVSLQTALPLLGSQYAFAKGVVQSSWYHPVGRHVIGIHGLAGAVFGDAPYFEQFFVGDLNFLLPPRALGLNFSTLPCGNFLGTSVAAHRYDAFAARLVVEYAVPMWRRRGFVYGGDRLRGPGAFALASG